MEFRKELECFCIYEKKNSHEELDYGKQIFFVKFLCVSKGTKENSRKGGKGRQNDGERANS